MGSVSLLLLLLSGAPDPRQALDPPQAPDPPAATTTNDSGAPITGIGRLNWTVHSTIGPASLWIGVLSAGWGTAFNHPREYGESFVGFSKRYGLRLAGIATDNTLEAGVGAFWGEDPRYHRADSTRPRSRLGHVARMTFMAENREGDEKLAYARYIGIGGGNALADLWRPDSERTASNTMIRIGEGFGGRFLCNLWDEFWPDLKGHMPWSKR